MYYYQAASAHWSPGRLSLLSCLLSEHECLAETFLGGHAPTASVGVQFAHHVVAPERAFVLQNEANCLMAPQCLKAEPFSLSAYEAPFIFAS